MKTIRIETLSSYEEFETILDEGKPDVIEVSFLVSEFIRLIGIRSLLGWAPRGSRAVTPNFMMDAIDNACFYPFITTSSIYGVRIEVVE